MATTLKAPAVKVFERLTLTAPLGLVFHDAATGERVGAGLSVVVYKKFHPLSLAQAQANPSGVYVLHRAPGLDSEFAFGAGDDLFWSQLPPPRDYVVEVSDTEGRFLPFSFEVSLPQRGVYEWQSPVASPPADSPPDAEQLPSVPVYSAATRRTPPGVAAVRAELQDTSTAAPAAHAAVELRHAGRLVARGLSDARGRLALLFPHPAPQRAAVTSPADSPPAARNTPLVEQTWELEIEAAYTGSVALSAAQGLPDLRAALTQLNGPRAQVWDDREGGEELTAFTIQFGRETVLRSRDPAVLSPPARQSALLVTPAA
jgi:hypothetical protein